MPLISSIYTVDQMGQCNIGDDESFLKFIWPGDDDICYGEDVNFYDKIDNPEEIYPSVWLKGSCKALGYGNKQKCTGKGNNRSCKTYEERTFQ